MLSESRVSEQRPAAVAAGAGAAAARAMGEEAIELKSGHEGEVELSRSFVSYEENPAAVFPRTRRRRLSGSTRASPTSTTTGPLGDERLIIARCKSAESTRPRPLVSKPGMSLRAAITPRTGTPTPAGASPGGKALSWTCARRLRSPFLGELAPGQPQESLETSPRRAARGGSRSARAVSADPRAPRRGISSGRFQPAAQPSPAPRRGRPAGFEERAFICAAPRRIPLASLAREGPGGRHARQGVGHRPRHPLDKDIRRRIRRAASSRARPVATERRDDATTTTTRTSCPDRRRRPDAPDPAARRMSWRTVHARGVEQSKSHRPAASSRPSRPPGTPALSSSSRAGNYGRASYSSPGEQPRGSERARSPGRRRGRRAEAPIVSSFGSRRGRRSSTSGLEKSGRARLTTTCAGMPPTIPGGYRAASQLGTIKPDPVTMPTRTCAS